MDVQLTCVLDAESSARLFETVERGRIARGWTRLKLARRANYVSAQRTALTADVLNSWSYKRANGTPIRIELDKALALLAAVDLASNRVDGLLTELGDAVAQLLEDAAPPPSQPDGQDDDGPLAVAS